MSGDAETRIWSRHFEAIVARIEEANGIDHHDPWAWRKRKGCRRCGADLERTACTCGADGTGPRIKPPSFVYVIGPLTGHVVKIGVSRNVERRLSEAQTMNPLPLKVLWTTPGDHGLERRLHRKFARYRMQGEWFDFGDADPVTTIQPACKSPMEQILAALRKETILHYDDPVFDEPMILNGHDNIRLGGWSACDLQEAIIYRYRNGEKGAEQFDLLATEIAEMMAIRGLLLLSDVRSGVCV